MPLLDAAFRPFFLAAAGFSILTVLAWTLIYTAGWALPLRGLSLFHWHAHEMIYGYAMAVVAGFLLTAIERWTGVPRLRGPRLIVLLVLWAVPRVLLLFGTHFLLPAAMFDIAFISTLAVLIARSIVLSRQWHHLGIMIKLSLFIVGQACFYLGALGLWIDGARVGVYLGFFMMIGLILTVARRVVPIFIKNGVDRPVRLYNPRWLGLTMLALYVPFFIMVLLQFTPRLIGGLSLALFFGHTLQLVGWYTNGIWRKPLLWSLYLSIVWIDVGFLLLAISSIGWISHFVALHAMAYGGIGLVTLSMMARVSLGHTNRSVHHPSSAIVISLVCITTGAVVRVLFPWWMPETYRIWIAVSQLLWLAGFSTFLLAYAKILLAPLDKGLLIDGPNCRASPVLPVNHAALR